MSRPGEPIAHVAELWRYPVKSMRGERVDMLDVVPRGIAHDRQYALLSSGAPAGKPRLTSRERAALLPYTASVVDGETYVLTPAGEHFRIHDARLLEHLEAALPQGHRITLGHDPAEAPYTDVRPIAITSTQTIAALQRTFGRLVDARRFRANLILTFAEEASRAMKGDPNGFPEDALCGRELHIGAQCRLRLLERIPRCRVVTLDPESAEPDPSLMRHLDRRHGGRVGIYAAVVSAGTVRQGDPVCLLP